VIPLALEESNVLRLAMADPLDDLAILEVENFTGKAVRPVLASLGDIQRAIGRCMAFSARDLFNPQIYRRVATVSVAAALLFLLAAGYLLHAEQARQREGTVSRANGSVIFKNHDLMVDVSPGGEIYFSGAVPSRAVLRRALRERGRLGLVREDPEGAALRGAARVAGVAAAREDPAHRGGVEEPLRLVPALLGKGVRRSW